LTVYTAFGTMHRHCCRRLSRFGWIWRSQLNLNRVYIQSKSAPEDGRICRPKYVGWFIMINKRKMCCVLLVVYMVCNVNSSVLYSIRLFVPQLFTLKSIFEYLTSKMYSECTHYIVLQNIRKVSIIKKLKNCGTFMCSI